MQTKFDNSGRVVTVTYETNRGGIREVSGVIVERPVFGDTSAPYRIRTSNGDIWARLNGEVSTIDRRIGYTIKITRESESL